MVDFVVALLTVARNCALISEKTEAAFPQTPGGRGGHELMRRRVEEKKKKGMDERGEEMRVEESRREAL